MKRFQRIAAVLTLRDQGDTAVLGWASLLARLAGSAEVICVHCWHPVDIPAEIRQRYPWLLEPEVQSLRERLDQLRKQHLSVDAGVRNPIELRQGSTLGEVLDLVEQRQVDLVVVGRNPDDHALAEKLARKAPCSVLAVPEGAPVRCTRVLGAVDFSPFSAGAVEVAAALTRAAQASLTLFHAYRLAWGHRRAVVHPEALGSDMRGHFLRELTGLSRSFADENLVVNVMVTEAALPAGAIADYVGAGNFDVVAIGCRGHHAIYATLLGSTAEAILRDCPRPVLAVKPKGSGVSLLEAMRHAD